MQTGARREKGESGWRGRGWWIEERAAAGFLWMPGRHLRACLVSCHVRVVWEKPSIRAGAGCGTTRKRSRELS